MIARSPELDEAARTLVQWARSRQSGWRDPSTDLLRALGNRYAALKDPEPDAAIPVGPFPSPGLPVANAPTPLSATPAYTAAASSQSGGAAVAGIAAPSIGGNPIDRRPDPPAPTAGHSQRATTAPQAQAVPSPPPSSAPATLPSGRSVTVSVGRWVPRIAIAASVVLAALAAPRVWRSYVPAASVTPAMGTASFDSTPAGSAVVIDGVEAGTTPLVKELPAGSHTVEFRYKKTARTVEITVVGGETVASAVDWTRKATGGLQVTSDVAATKVLVDGKLRGTAPLSLDGLSVGAHVVLLRSPQGSVKRTVTVKEGETATFAGSIYPGSLHVSAAFELEVSEAGQPLRLDDQNEVVLGPGPHTLRFVDRSTGLAEERTVEIEPGKRLSLTVSTPAGAGAVSTETAGTEPSPPPGPDAAASEPPAAGAAAAPPPEPSADPAPAPALDDAAR